MEIGRESLIALLQRQGYARTDTVADAGEYAVRGAIFDIHPSGLDGGLRLDFFGDEIEQLRLFDPGTQRSTGPVDQHLLLPASEALLDDDSVKRFRSRYREQFGANATSDPLYQAVSDGRRLAGIEHWLPLFEERVGDAVRSPDRQRCAGHRQCRAGRRRRTAGRHRRLSHRAHRNLGQEAGQLSPAGPRRAVSVARRTRSTADRLADPPRRHLRPAGKRLGARFRLYQRARFHAGTRPGGAWRRHRACTKPPPGTSTP